MRIHALDRRLCNRPDVAGVEIDDDELREAELVPHCYCRTAVGKGIRFADVRETGQPLVRSRSGSPSEEIMVEKSLVVGLAMRIDDGLAIACPPWRLDIAAVRKRERVKRFAW
jgi:hypothetical protein